MLGPTLSLAVSLQENPGVYALLLGSGASRSAGVPTGWDIILELIQRIAHLQDPSETISPEDAEAWYRERFDTAPVYGDLIRALADSQAERQQLLRRYFEPTDEERERGEKAPTPAHHAIADLVARGYIRVIVTTNFDRLMEQALQERGVVPTVIPTADAVKGDSWPPLRAGVYGDVEKLKSIRLDLIDFLRRVSRI